MWNCRVCKEKDARILDLKEQILAYRNQLNPPPRIQHFELEETAVMNGGGQEIIPAEEDAKYKDSIAAVREAERILSGNTFEVEVTEV